MDDLDYQYSIDAITDDGIATVTYYPDDARLKAVARNVSVPLRKARDLEHAQEILAQKIRGRAPQQEWAEALRLLEEEANGLTRPDPAELVEDLRNHSVRPDRRVRVESPRRETREERVRREFLADQDEPR